VSKITWQGGVIKPGEFEEFDVSVGALPEDEDYILFPAIQTYQNGEVVRWIDKPAAPGAEEPERPAPKLTLVDPEPEGAGGKTTATTASAAPASDKGLSVSNVATQDDVDSANTLGVVGIVVGILGLAVGGFALVRGLRSKPPSEA
jgi:hypothetical protein